MLAFKQSFSKLLQTSVLVVLTTCCLPRLGVGQTRVDEADARKNIISRAEPEFPAIAKQMSLSGRVEVDMHVDESGKVEKVDAVSGNPILAGAAVAAAKRWKFRPFEEEGKPNKTVVRIAFNFVR